MDYRDDFSSMFKTKDENINNANLYSFLVTNYDISCLAKEIVAAKSAKLNTLNLRKSSLTI